MIARIKMQFAILLIALAIGIAMTFSCATVYAQGYTSQAALTQAQAAARAGSGGACATTSASLAAPQNFTATTTPSTTEVGQATLHWTAVPGADGYQVYRMWPTTMTFHGNQMASAGSAPYGSFNAAGAAITPGTTTTAQFSDLPLFYPVSFAISTIKRINAVVQGQVQAVPCESARNFISGYVTPVGTANAQVWGFADTHTHEFANLGFGGLVIGNAFGDPLATLGSQVDFPGHGASLAFHIHTTGGYPIFDGWPTYRTLIHNQMYEDWLYRSFIGGLRLMVTLGVNNETLCTIYVQTIQHPPSCNDMIVATNQIQAAKSFEAYLNGQCSQGADPPRCPQKGMGWYHVVTSAEEARATINRGQLAVVLGIEVDRLFDCARTGAGDSHTNPQKICTDNDVRAGLDSLVQMGVRHIFPAHLADTAFAGMALYPSEMNWNYNSHFLNGQWINTKFQNGQWETVSSACPSEIYNLYPTPPDIEYNFNPDTLTGLEAAAASGLNGLGLPGNPPNYPYPAAQNPKGHCNSQGLMPLGNTLITEMMNRHLIIDIDHMSLRSVNDTFSLTWKARPNAVYPVIAGHTGPLGTAINTDRKNENAKSDNELAYLYQFGGLIGVGLGGTTADTKQTTTSWGARITNDCSSSSKSWAQNYLYTVDHLGGPDRAAVAFASDQPLNPFLGPRFGHSGNDTPVSNEVIRGCEGKDPTTQSNEERAQLGTKMVTYPIPIVVNNPGYSSSAPVQLWQSKLGNGAWDFNLDGMAHIGMYPDLLQDATNLGLTPRDLGPAYRSAERYIEMWEKVEGTFDADQSSMNTPPASTTSSAPVRSITPTAIARTPVMSTATAVRLAMPELSVAAADVHLAPTAPHLGQSVTFTALIRNTGGAAAQNASAIFRIYADGRQATVSQPIVFSVAPNGTFQLNWSAPIPAGKAMQVSVAVTATGDTNTSNNQATVAFTESAPPLANPPPAR